MIRSISVWLGSAFLLWTMLALHASDATFDGAWRVEFARPGGVTLRTYFVLHHADTGLEGKVIINNAVDLPLRQARMEGSNVVFSVDWGTAYRLTSMGDTLRVSIIYRGGSKDETTATRVADSEAQPPATLPPPPIKPVPTNGLALAPPMGWSSWNHFGSAVDDRTIRETADAMVRSGMAVAGYVYVNIDDSWEGGRDGLGNLVPNTKFPNMHALADYVHARGLKLGIYSSPGPRTCGGYEGSYGHEDKDAATFAAWGIDYLKYDWCSAARVYGNMDLQAVCQKMGTSLARCGRPIFYNLCEYGMAEVWTWGPLVGANSWRTTDDIQDNWESMSQIGFNQGHLARFAGPGHWNDPDMLEVGNGGMTTLEYRTHFSLWCLLSAPLIAGNDLRNMTPETLDILTNKEAIAIDQDPLGRQGERILQHNHVEVWAKTLTSGNRALGFFNRGEDSVEYNVNWVDLGFQTKPSLLRDVWNRSNEAVSGEGWHGQIPRHGAILLVAEP